MDQVNNENNWSEDSKLHALHQQLVRLASAWREVDGDPNVQAQYVGIYHATMRTMIEQGWNPVVARLDDQAMLVDSEMPRAYQQQMNGEPYAWNPIPATPEEKRAMGVQHDVDQGGEALNPELASLEHAIERIAQEWWGAVGLPARCRTIIATYHAVMERMFELGWSGLIDPDAELPDAWMPSEYLQQTGAHDDSWYEQHQKVLSADVTDEWVMIDTAVSGIRQLSLMRVPKLYAAAPEQRKKWQLTEDQKSVEWPELGVRVHMDIFMC